MSESLVDLLLVRLGREEEKRKVLKLLVTSLDLSVDDAEKAVESSPSVIREAVPMAEARLIQKDLYPYIDLLPRFADESSGDPGSIQDEIRDVSRPSAEDVPGEDSDEEDFTDDYGSDDYGSDEYTEDEPEPHEEEPEADEEDEEDDQVLITSAGDEIRNTARCHICGRTPVDGERLAPCRTCGDLTCKDCFDRVAHVCNKCAASGKTVEHANEGVEMEKEQGLVFDSDDEKEEKRSSGGNLLRNLLFILLILVALGAAFYLVDPLDMFSTGTGPVSLPEEQPADTADVAAADTAELAPADTLETAGTVPDTSGTAVEDPGFTDPYAVRRLELAEEYSSIADPPELEMRSSLPRSISDAVILRHESDLITHQLSVLSAWIPVTIDDAALMEWHDSTSVLLLVITHPVETEIRMDLMRRTADWLTPSNVDQLVLIYRENRFQSIATWSLLSESFQDVQGILNPSMFQNLLGYREDCWEAITGPVTDWLISN